MTATGRSACGRLLRPHLVSAAAIAALAALGGFDDAEAVMDEARALAVMEEALVLLRGGLDALRRHPPI